MRLRMSSMFSSYRVGFSPTTRRMLRTIPGVQPRDSNCFRGMRIAAEAIAISITLQEAEGRKAVWMYGTTTITVSDQIHFNFY